MFAFIYELSWKRWIAGERMCKREKKEKKERATNMHNASTYDARFIVGYQRSDDRNDPGATRQLLITASWYITRLPVATTRTINN